jgi:hypothetical protein
MRRKSAESLLCALYSAREGVLDLLVLYMLWASLSLETNKINKYNVFESFRDTIHSRRLFSNDV